MMLLIVNAVHAGAVTALVVDEDEAFGASLADVAKNVVLTPEDVDVAVPLEEMVEGSALDASAPVLGGLFAGDQAGLGVGWCAEHDQDSSEQ